MCGISGAIAFNRAGHSSLERINAATGCLASRGPDKEGIYRNDNIVFGHRRLSVIDTSELASQPMTDESGRFTIIFNGEFFNFREHRELLHRNGVRLNSESDTEVLLHLYIQEGEKCLQRINGFFAFAIYDREEKTVFIARDRMGVKPLVYTYDNDRFLFASEIKALIAFGLHREPDEVSLYHYLQLNYVPGPHSIFKGVKKLRPGCYMTIKTEGENNPISEVSYYQIPYPKTEKLLIENSGSYTDQQARFRSLLEDSVKRRLIADVPLGTFLSGGIDSSVITAIAARNTTNLKTFSIGFRDEPLFDETRYAELVAKKYNTEHTVFKLSNDDLFQNLFHVLDYLDEPFADSSALNVFILSKETRKHVTVALSGDGADELFGGYNKHAAEYKARTGGILNHLLKISAPLFSRLPQSRNSRTANLIRKASRFAEGLRLNEAERYWRWASFENEHNAASLLWNQEVPEKIRQEYLIRKHEILKHLKKEHSLQEVLYTDMQLVLVNDMLVKTDLMSMANSLEIRTPFLDYTVVDYAFSLPLHLKIDSHGRKKILRDTFRNDLPQELYQRSKQGFEVPLLKWFRNELRSLIEEDYLSRDFIETQNIFRYDKIQALQRKLFSNSPGDSQAQIWALIVFQHWWKKWMN